MFTHFRKTFRVSRVGFLSSFIAMASVQNCAKADLSASRAIASKSERTSAEIQSDFSYGDSPLKMVVGQADQIAPVRIPSVAITSTTISPDLPAGLKIDGKGVISGVPIASLNETSFVVVAQSSSATYQTIMKLRVNNPLFLSPTVNPNNETTVDINWMAPDVAGVDGYRVILSLENGETKSAQVSSELLTARFNSLLPGSKLRARVFALTVDTSVQGSGTDVSEIGWTPYTAMNADNVSTPPEEPFKPRGIDAAVFSDNFSIVWSFYYNPGFTPVFRSVPSKLQRGDYYYNSKLYSAFKDYMFPSDDVMHMWTNGIDKFILNSARGGMHMWDYLPTTPDRILYSRKLGLGTTGQTSFAPFTGWGGTPGLNYACFDASENKLFVSDMARHRIMVFNGWPAASDASAQFVLGQPNFDTYTSGTTSNKMSAPGHISCEGGILAVSDWNNNRVLVWRNPITSNQQTPDFIYGQSNATSGSANGAGGMSVGGLNAPLGVLVLPRSDGGHALVVADNSNVRIVEWELIPAAPASQTFPGAFTRVYGQPDASSSTPNNGGRSLSSLHCPVHLSHERDKNGVVKTDLFWTTDACYYNSSTNNERVLKYRRGTLAAIDLWGNADGSTVTNGWVTHVQYRYSTRQDRGGFWLGNGSYYNGLESCMGTTGLLNIGSWVWKTPPKESSVSSDYQDTDRCHGVVASGRSWIVKGSSVYGYNLAHPRDIPATLPTPSVILGRKLFDGTDNTAVPDTREYKFGASYYFPTFASLSAIGNYILAVDENRVVIWNTSGLTVSHPVITNVIGQPDKTTNGANQGGVSAATLSGPNALTVSDGKIIIADTGNNRVLIYNALPTGANAAADVVVGQPDGVTTTAGTSLAGMTGPSSVAVINGKLVVVDMGNKRLLVWNSIPTSSGTAANKDLDLRNYKFGLPSWYSPDALYPRWIKFNDGRVYIGQYGRVLVLPDIF